MLIFIFLILFANANEGISQIIPKKRETEFAKFNKTVPSIKIMPECEYKKGDETGIFSITYKKNKINNLFLVMKGLDPETCKWHVDEINKLKRRSRLLTLSGHAGSIFFDNQNEIVWTWQSVKSDKNCHGYFDHDCPK